MKLYLLPPAEGKKLWWVDEPMSRTFGFPLPLDIAGNATQKDLKCTWKRYEEARHMNQEVAWSPVMYAIERYTGVLYSALGYQSLQKNEQQRVANNVLIVSWMFWLLHPEDSIPNYKLPIWTSWLRAYWYPHLTAALITYMQENNITEIVDLLSWVYQRMIDRKTIHDIGIWHTIPHLTGVGTMTHSMKVLRGRWLREECLHESNRISST